MGGDVLRDVVSFIPVTRRFDVRQAGRPDGKTILIAHEVREVIGDRD